MNILLRPRNNEPYACSICGARITPGSLTDHLQRHHGMTVEQYRVKFNIPGQSFRFEKGNVINRGRIPCNKLPLVTVSCAICGKSITMPGSRHKKFLKRKCKFYCSSKCNKLGRGKNISSAKTADAANIGRKTKETWGDPTIRARRVAGLIEKNKDLVWLTNRIAKAHKHAYFRDGKFKNTSIELKMQAEFERHGLVEGKDFFKHFPTCGTLTDFYFPATRTIVECDGDYWHNRPESKVRDIKQNKAFAKNKFKVFRFWEHEINSGVQACFNKIKEHINVA